MLTWSFEAYGDPAAALRLRETEAPAPRDGELLIEVSAAAVNFADALMIRGEYQARSSLPATPGMEIAGRVVGPVPEGAGFGPGDRVVAMTRDLTGGYGQVAAAAVPDVFAAPAELDDPHAAAFLVSYQTAWFGLHRRAGVRPGDVVLVHAAAGGVGSAVVQLANAAKARVIGVVGGFEKVGVATALGCELVVNRSTEDIVEAVRRFTGGRGADIVIDPVGGSSFEASVRAVGFEGRVVVVGFTSGAVPRARAEHLLVKNYSVVGLHWGLYRERNPEAVREAYERLTDLVGTGEIEPFVSRVLPFADAPAALAAVTGGSSVGRVVLHGSWRTAPA